MRKLLPVVFSGLFAVSFSQLATAQGAGVQGRAGADANVDLNKDAVQGRAGTDANVDVNKDSSARDRDAPASGGASADDKNPDSPGKGWAKGHARGKGHGANDERHGGRHSQSDEQSSSGSSQEEKKD